MLYLSVAEEILDDGVGLCDRLLTILKLNDAIYAKSFIILYFLFKNYARIQPI